MAAKFKFPCPCTLRRETVSIRRAAWRMAFQWMPSSAAVIRLALVRPGSERKSISKSTAALLSLSFHIAGPMEGMKDSFVPSASMPRSMARAAS